MYDARQCARCGAFVDAKPVTRTSPVTVLVVVVTIAICGGTVFFAKMGERRELTDEEKQRIIERNPTPTPRPTPRLDHLAEFRHRIEANGDAPLIADVKLDDNNPDKLVIIVKDEWHYQNKGIKKEIAALAWKLWAAVHSPNNPDAARLSIRDRAGNEVGGLKMMGGVWVDD